MSYKHYSKGLTCGSRGATVQGGQRFTARNRKAFAITDTELRAMAALARMGLSSSPKNGYRTPAATGMPIEF